MKNGPDLWTELLKHFPPGAVIAGGAVRDYLLRVEPKDIDVFYTYEASEDPRRCLMRIDDQHERFEEYQAVSGISMVSRGTLLGHRVDAIELADEGDLDPVPLVEGFDFGITRCWFDGRFLHATPEMLADMKNHTVTQLMPSRGDRQLRRFRRFNERMGGTFRLVPQPETVDA